MSRGNQVVRLRLAPDMLTRLDEEVRRQNESAAGEPYDRSSWIRQAMKERFAHLDRSRRKKPRA